MTGYKYMCRLCKTFLSKTNPKLYVKYEECTCKSDCQFNKYINQFEQKEQLDKMYEFWNTIPSYRKTEQRLFYSSFFLIAITKR